MAKTESELQLSARLRTLLSEQLGSRGKFAWLESLSNIPAHRWKNFAYGKQAASPEMVAFAEAQFPEWAIWLQTGNLLPEQKDYPFAAPVPTHLAKDGTIAMRLAWVVHEFASPRGEALFEYLEQRSRGQIKADKWAAVILNNQTPTLDMILLVADARPHFFEWICRGRIGYPLQVDPLDKDSVAAYRRRHLQPDNK